MNDDAARESLRYLINAYEEAAADKAGTDGIRRCRDVARELLASRTAAGLATVLCSDEPQWSWTHPAGKGGRLLGTALRGGGGTGFPARNPWGIAADATVESAIRTAWAGAADLVPQLVEFLLERVFAVALVSLDDGYQLAYLHGATIVSEEIDWRAPVPELLAESAVNVEVVWGSAPAALTDSPLLGPVPPPLREFARVHPRVRTSVIDGFLDCGGFDPYVVVDPDTEQPDASRKVAFAGFQDGAAVIDLDLRDGDGAFLIMEHDCNDGLRTRETWPLGDWMRDQLPFFLTGE